MSAGLLAEIQGADVKSILRQKREQLSASLKQEAKEEASPRIPEPQQEPQPQLDMLQRRKLLFIESSSSDDSSDWDMSDYICLLNKYHQLRKRYNKFSTVRTKFLYS